MFSELQLVGVVFIWAWQRRDLRGSEYIIEYVNDSIEGVGAI